MPIIKYKCDNPKCDGHIAKFYKKASEIVPFFECAECGVGKLKRTLSAPTSKSTQIVDNGVQARQVEVMDVVVEKELDKIHRGE